MAPGSYPGAISSSASVSGWNAAAGTALDEACLQLDLPGLFCGNRRTGFVLFEQLLEENLRGPAPDLFDRLLDDADRWTYGRSKLKVVEAQQGDGLGHGNVEFLKGLEGIDCRAVLERENCVGRVWSVQQALDRVFSRAVVPNRRVENGGQVRGFNCLAVSSHALSNGIKRTFAGQANDALVPMV